MAVKCVGVMRPITPVSLTGISSSFGCGRTCVPNAGMCYGGIGHRSPPRMGCFGKCRPGSYEPPRPVRSHAGAFSRNIGLTASKGDKISSDVELAARRRGPALPLTVRRPKSFYLCGPIVGALFLMVTSITFDTDPAEAAKCSGIRDSARCAAQPDCHFDVNKRRSSQGPRPTEDACVVHVDFGVT
jgi:hypothetical protein